MDSILELVSQQQHNEHKGRDHHMKELRCLLFFVYFFFAFALLLSSSLSSCTGLKFRLGEERDIRVDFNEINQLIQVGRCFMSHSGLV